MLKIKLRKEIHIMIYGYGRVSTKGQAKDGNSLEAQERLLKEHGARPFQVLCKLKKLT